MMSGSELRTRPPAARPPIAAPAGASLVPLLLLLTACGGQAAHRPPVEASAAIAGTARGPQLGPDGQFGVYHRLESGQTLYRLSRVYDVPIDQLIAVNRIDDPTDIPAGSPIFIPGAVRLLPYPGRGEGRLVWPLRGPITSRFGRPRGRRAHHAGLDIDGNEGDTIRASAAGRVVEAGRGGRYGRYVLVDHGGGLQTLYAHASRLLVKRGQRVAAGEAVALVGHSGNARGSHLHFEVRRDGRPIDPQPLLRGTTSSKTAGH